MPEKLTAEQARAAGLVPANMEWAEDLQEPIARGEALIVRGLDQPLDLQKNLEAFALNRTTLLRFVGQYLAEADYDEKKLPVPGKMRDYYLVPGASTKALTKLGAEKLSDLYRYRRGATDILAVTETKEYVSAQVRVTLIDQYRRAVGSAVSGCSTAEGSFASDRAKRKYGGDYRAALNDVIARASKRAFVQAMIQATAADEIFTSAEAVRDSEEPEPEASTGGPAFPEPAPGPIAKLADVKSCYEALFAAGIRKATYEKFYAEAVGRPSDGNVYESDIPLLLAAALKYRKKEK